MWVLLGHRGHLPGHMVTYPVPKPRDTSRTACRCRIGGAGRCKEPDFCPARPSEQVFHVFGDPEPGQ